MTEMDYDPTMRRLPVYVILDCSYSMSGDPIEAVRQGMKTLLGELQGDPQALDTAYVSIITFDSDARQVIPLTELALVKEPQLEADGATSLGEALTLLMDCINREVRKTTEEQKGDWKPLIFLMTDGEPTDSWERPADAIKQARPGNFIACAAGAQANEDVLKRITEIVVRLNDLQPGTLEKFFKWVSDSIRTTSQSVAAKQDAPVKLPPPPPEIEILP